MSDHQNPQWRELLASIGDPQPRAAGWPDMRWLAAASERDVDQLLARLLECAETRSPHEGLLTGIFRQLCARLRQIDQRGWPEETRGRLVRLYRVLGPDTPCRCLLLQMLAMTLQPADLAAFAALIVDDPPADRKGVGLALGPLFQRRGYDPSPLFPQLLNAISQPGLAAEIVDLCNHLTREGIVSEHPVLPRKEEFAALLGHLAQRLARMGETSPADKDLRDTAQQVEDSVSLAVALCDACALIGDTAAIGKLRQALEPPHRRLRTEAAAALARLGEEEGRETLTALAAEPVCRLRVLAYAEELGLLDRVPPQHQTPAARAEAELALWLAQPAQIGVPPTRLELIDQRSQYWPGFEEPVERFLFRFVYQFDAGEYSNLGVAGPLTHAFSADLADLGPEDIYAAFAGWHVEHEEIFEVDVHDLSAPDRVEVARLERRLRDAGYDAIQPLRLGNFLGEKLLAARATWESQPGIAVVDQRDVIWFPSAGRSRPLGATEACCIYKGRKLLRSFNA